MQEIIGQFKEVKAYLTGLEIFFIGTTIVSIFLNLYQFMESRKLKEWLLTPIHSQLVGLFNDIKSKLAIVYVTQQLLGAPKNPHKDIETLRWEYFLFTYTVIGYLNGFQEIVRGTLSTLKPEDNTGEAAFKAADYGLTGQERKLRDEYMRRYTTQPPDIAKSHEETEKQEDT